MLSLTSLLITVLTMESSMASTDLEKHRDEAALEPEHVASSPVTKTLSKRQQLSPYFTIAAAAFGLISDGCELKSILDNFEDNMIVHRPEQSYDNGQCKSCSPVHCTHYIFLISYRWCSSNSTLSNTRPTSPLEYLTPF